jgi:CRP-like cAMP-binding protein
MTEAPALSASAPPPRTEFPLVEKLGAYLALSEAEVDFLGGLHEQRRKFQRHRDIIAAGRRYDEFFILSSGLVSRYKVLADGKRQILNLGLPGDFIGFPSCLFEVAVNSVSSLTDVVVCPVSFRDLFDLFARFPRVGTALFWSAACEIALYGEHLVDPGITDKAARRRSGRRAFLHSAVDAGIDGGCTRAQRTAHQPHDQVPPRGRSCDDRRPAGRRS